MSMSALKDRRVQIGAVAILLVIGLTVYAFGAFQKPLPSPRAPGSVEIPSGRSEADDPARSGGNDVVGVLLVGSDRRPGTTEERGDALMYAIIDTRQRKMQLISIARDSYVTIPGRGRDKINSAFRGGDIERLKKAVRGVLGLPIDHYAIAEFWDIRKVVNEMGGVTIERQRALVDGPSGARIPAGRFKLDGKQALALTRARYALGRLGDFGRQANQQSLVLATLEDKLWNAENPKLDTYVGLFEKELETDLPPFVALKMAEALAQMGREDVTTVVLPGRIDYAGKVSVVFLDNAAVRRITNDVRKRFGLD